MPGTKNAAAAPVNVNRSNVMTVIVMAESFVQMNRTVALASASTATLRTTVHPTKFATVEQANVSATQTVIAAPIAIALELTPARIVNVFQSARFTTAAVTMIAPLATNVFLPVTAKCVAKR